jgi:Holliday junction DNA helicase RuvA
MIKSIKGIILNKDNSGIIIDVNPLSLYCLVPRIEEYTIGDFIEVNTELIWNSDTGPHLYGFKNLEEKNMFLLLISCSGVGPKYALNILSYFTLSSLVEIIKEKNIKLLSQSPGIGIKKAELIVVELKNKINSFIFLSDKNEKNISQEKITELIEVLKHLGYKPAEIHKAITYIEKDDQLNNLEIEYLIKEVMIKLNV